MYNFSYYKDKDPQEVLDFIEQYPFALVTGSFKSGLQVATQVPFLLEEKNGDLFLQGHIMRNTDHHKAWIENSNALVVFSGPSCYVSASWYSDPNSASTWNYMSVHIAGKVRFMKDDELVTAMRKLTLKFEGGDPKSQTIYDNLPRPYVEKMMPAIVGIEIRAEKIDHVFKLSQNKDEESYQNIISQLTKQSGSAALIAEEMAKRKDKLFRTRE